MTRRQGRSNPNKDLAIALLDDIGAIPRREMAEIFDDTESGIRSAINRAKSSGILAVYQESKADLLETVQANLMAELLSRDFSQESLRDVTNAFAVIFDKARLERGQSTENMAFMINVIDSVANERLAVRSQSGVSESALDTTAENIGVKNPFL